jgi:hypothetical protein
VKKAPAPNVIQVDFASRSIGRSGRTGTGDLHPFPTPSALGRPTGDDMKAPAGDRPSHVVNVLMVFFDRLLKRQHAGASKASNDWLR